MKMVATLAIDGHIVIVFFFSFCKRHIVIVREGKGNIEAIFRTFKEWDKTSYGSRMKLKSHISRGPNHNWPFPLLGFQ